MALAVPPKLRELDVGVMAADQINQKTCAALIDLHKDSKNLAVQGRIQHDNSNVVDMQIRQTEVFVINEYFRWVDELIVNCAIEANKQFNFNKSTTIIFMKMILLPFFSCHGMLVYLGFVVTVCYMRMT